MSKPAAKRPTSYTFNDETMALVEKVVDHTPDDNLMALFDPGSGLAYFGIPGPLLKVSLVSGRDAKRYTHNTKDFGRGVVGHVYKAWMPSQLAALQRLVDSYDDEPDGPEDGEPTPLDGLAEEVAMERMEEE